VSALTEGECLVIYALIDFHARRATSRYRSRVFQQRRSDELFRLYIGVCGPDGRDYDGDYNSELRTMGLRLGGWARP